MKKTPNTVERVISKAVEDEEFRSRLLTNPKHAIEREIGTTLVDGHEIVVHEETDSTTHLVLPPRDKLTSAERESAKTGAASLEFLKKTMHDPAPPLRNPSGKAATLSLSSLDSESLATAARETIRRGLDFVKSTVEDNGAWHCIRFNLGNPEIPRHYEKPPFITAFCTLALQSSREPKARGLCARAKEYLVHTMEFPGFWRYYLHLPQDLDSTTLCSLVVDSHPWIGLGRNVARILANKDDEGRFMTWLLDVGQPDVVAPFRIEADPVLNANVIAYLGDIEETKEAQQWLVELITEGSPIEGSSKWYPDPVSLYYAISRAMTCAHPVLDKLSPALADRILGLRNEEGDFANIFQAAQAVSALYNIGLVDRIDVKWQIDQIISWQNVDGSWPEILAFGDQSLQWGAVGQIGHGSESVTSAFCIEALERLLESLEF